MKKRLVLLQALAILIAVFKYDTREAGQDEERNSNKVLSNNFYHHLKYRYLRTKLSCIKQCSLLPSSQHHTHLNFVSQLLWATKLMFWTNNLHSFLQCTSWPYESSPYLCMSATNLPKLLQNASVEGAATSTHQDPIYLWRKGELMLSINRMAHILLRIILKFLC